MKKSLFFLVAFFVLYGVKSQDVIYTINNWGAIGITQRGNANPENGSISGTPITYGNTPISAALSINSANYLYYIPEVTDNKGAFEVYSIQAQSSNTMPESSNEPVNVLASIDLNGASNNNIFYRRLGIDANGWAYLMGTEAMTGVIYFAKFQTKNNGAASNFQSLGKIRLNDNESTANFNNGDLAFDGNGNMFVLVNEDIGGGSTKLYIASASDVAAANSATSITTVIRKWIVQTPAGDNFESAVTGLAFSSTGSLFLSAQGTDGGLFFIDQNTVNSNGPGTVQLVRVMGSNTIGDVATNYFPTSTTLPVEYKSMKATIANSQMVVEWTTATEINNARFEVQISNDGNTFKTAATIATKAANGNSNEDINYNTSIGLNEALSLMGIGLLSLGFITLLFNRKNKLLMSFIMIIGAGILGTSCSKNDKQIDVENNNKIFVRIKQIDVDGKSKVSKVFSAYNAD